MTDTIYDTDLHEKYPTDDHEIQRIARDNRAFEGTIKPGNEIALYCIVPDHEGGLHLREMPGYRAKVSEIYQESRPYKVDGVGILVPISIGVAEIYKDGEPYQGKIIYFNPVDGTELLQIDSQRKGNYGLQFLLRFERSDKSE